jgi:hypothetical protein
VDVLRNIAAHPAVGGLGLPLAFGGQHLDQLPSARHAGRELLERRVGVGAQRGPHPVGEEGEEAGVDRVGLRQAAERFGEVPHLAGIHDDDREAGRGEGPGHRHFVAAGRLQHDGRRAQRVQAALWHAGSRPVQPFGLTTRRWRRPCY